ncbi:hypothetical protein D3C86_1195880 [compost metagenome]
MLTSLPPIKQNLACRLKEQYLTITPIINLTVSSTLMMCTVIRMMLIPAQVEPIAAGGIKLTV